MLLVQKWALHWTPGDRDTHWASTCCSNLLLSKGLPQGNSCSSSSTGGSCRWANKRSTPGNWMKGVKGMAAAPPPHMLTLGLRMDDDVVRVAVGLCLRVSFCQPHHCHQCGMEVDDHLGLRGLSCRMSQGQHSHAAVNELIRRTLVSAKVPSHLEPSGTLCVKGEKLRWGNGDALEVWLGPGMRCNMPRYLCPLTSGPCCQGGRCGCKPSRAEKYRKVCPPQYKPPLCALCYQDLGSVWTWGTIPAGRHRATNQSRDWRATVLPVPPPPRGFGSHPVGNAASVLGTAHMIDTYLLNSWFALSLQ